MSLSFDKKIIQKNFSRGAKNYDELALIQKLTAKNLCEISAPFIQENCRILDLGCGTSFIAKNLCDKKNIEIFELDLSLEMLKSWPERPNHVAAIQGDFEKLPFKKESFDILISSFSLQWLKNFEQNFTDYFALLKNGGKLIFAIPTDKSLQEIKSAKIFNFIDFPTNKNLKLAAKKSGFKEIFFSEEKFFQTAYKASQHLKIINKIGANYSDANSNPITKSQLIALDNFCSKNSTNPDKTTTVSWFVSFFIFQK